MENIIFPEIIFQRNYVSLTPVYYTCSNKPIMHVDDCFKFKRYNQQNFVLNTTNDYFQYYIILFEAMLRK